MHRKLLGFKAFGVGTERKTSVHKKVSYETEDGVTLSAIIDTVDSSRNLGNAILAHGLNNNKDENCSFVKLSKLLRDEGFNVIRFDFRSHGRSSGKTQDVTIQGELVDFETSVKWFDDHLGRKNKYVVVASSFGASSSILYASKHPDRVLKIVLWNPVLDYDKTFLHAITPWGRRFFNEEGYRNLESKGYLQIPGTDFRISKRLVQEFQEIKPYEILSSLKMPVLTIHGTRDTSVPYSVSKQYGVPNERSKFISHNAEHTFVGMRKEVIAETVDWIVKDP